MHREGTKHLELWEGVLSAADPYQAGRRAKLFLQLTLRLPGNFLCLDHCHPEQHQPPTARVLPSLRSKQVNLKAKELSSLKHLTAVSKAVLRDTRPCSQSRLQYNEQGILDPPGSLELAAASPAELRGTAGTSLRD